MNIHIRYILDDGDDDDIVSFVNYDDARSHQHSNHKKISAGLYTRNDEGLLMFICDVEGSVLNNLRNIDKI